MTRLYIHGHFAPVDVTDSAAEIMTTKEQILKLTGHDGETVWVRVPDIAVVVDRSTANPPRAPVPNPMPLSTPPVTGTVTTSGTSGSIRPRGAA